MPSTPLSYFPAPFGLFFLRMGTSVAQERAQAKTQCNINSIIFTCFFPSSRELSPSWAATKRNTYYRKTQCSLAPNTKCHLKIRVFKASKISVNTRICISVLQVRAQVCAGGHHCPSDHNISPRTEEPILARGHPKCGFLMALPVGCTLAVQTWQSRNLFLTVLLFQAHHNKEQSLIKCQ